MRHIKIDPKLNGFLPAGNMTKLEAIAAQLLAARTAQPIEDPLHDSSWSRACDAVADAHQLLKALAEHNNQGEQP